MKGGTNTRWPSRSPFYSPEHRMRSAKQPQTVRRPPFGSQKTHAGRPPLPTTPPVLPRRPARCAPPRHSIQRRRSLRAPVVAPSVPRPPPASAPGPNLQNDRNNHRPSRWHSGRWVVSPLAATVAPSWVLSSTSAQDREPAVAS